MQYVCIRKTKRLKKGINIHDQLFTIHIPSGEYKKSAIKQENREHFETNSGAVIT